VVINRITLALSGFANRPVINYLWCLSKYVNYVVVIQLPSEIAVQCKC
jgi:hypothetical protein